MAVPTPSIDKLLKKLEKEPNSLIFLQLVEEYRKEGDYADALRVCRDGLRRHPNYWSARVALGRIHHEMGDSSRAREELERVIKAVPDNLLANKLLGDIYRNSSMLPEALKRYQLVQMLTPNDQEVAAAIQQIESQLSIRPASLSATKATPPPVPAAPRAPQQETPAAVIPEPPAAAQVAPESPASGADIFSEPLVFPEPPSSLEKTAPGVRLGGLDPLDSTMPQDALLGGDLPPTSPEPESTMTEDLASMFLESAHSNEVPETAPFEGVEEEHFPASIPPADFPGGMKLSAPVPEVRSEDRTQPMAEKPPGDESSDFYGDELTTQTLAELYVQQGLTDKAVRVYQKLLLNDPGNQQIVQRLRDLNPADALLSRAASFERETVAAEESGDALQAPAAAGVSMSSPASRAYDDVTEERKRKITTLENWLAAIRRERS